MQRSKVTAALRYVVLLAFGLLLLYLAFRGQNLDVILYDLKNADYLWVGVSLIMILLAHFLRAIRWRMLIRPLGFRPKVSNTYHAVIIGYLANLALPRMGEITRCGILNRTDKVPVNSLIGTVITERLIDAFCLILVTVLALLLKFDVISGFVYEHVLKNIFDKAASGLVIVLSLLVFFGGLFFLSRYLLKKYKFRILRWGFVRKTINMLNGFRKGFTSIARMENRGLFWFFTVLIWGCYLLATYFGFRALPSTNGLDIGVALVALALGSLGMAAPVQAGIGPYHWMTSEGLTFFGLSREAGLAYATISHTSSQILLILLLGAISMIAVFLETSGKIRKK